MMQTKPRYFPIIITILQVLNGTSMFAIVVAVLTLTYNYFTGKSDGMLLNGNFISRPILKLPVELKFRECTDTTITFENKEHPEYGTDSYHSRERFDPAGALRPNSYTQHNAVILENYRKGMYQPTDTTVYKMVGMDQLHQKPLPFNFSKPREVTGYILAEPHDKTAYRWIMTYNFIVSLISSGFILWFLSRLHVLFNNIREGNYFSNANFKLLRWLGILIMLSPLIEWLREYPLSRVFDRNSFPFFDLIHSDLPHIGRDLFYITQR